MRRLSWIRPCAVFAAMLAVLEIGRSAAIGQEVAPFPRPIKMAIGDYPWLADGPTPTAADRPLQVNLATALQLARVRPLDIALAAQRVQIAAAQLERANVLWLPTVYLGVDYSRHDGQIQSVEGNIFGTSRSSFMIGAGPSAVFGVTDAIFEPLAARQTLRARDGALQTAKNDTLLAVAEAYFAVQQARGELAGLQDVVRRLEDLVRRVEKLAPGILAPVEPARARAELARRRLYLHSARERWRVASTDLARLLRLDVTGLIEPLEPPHLIVTLVDIDRRIDDLIALALTNRPELSAQQALVQATLYRLRQERLRPFIPGIWLRGASTNPGGTLAGGWFGGGRNDDLATFGPRGDFDIQLLWEFQNLGLGNRARVNQVAAENQASLLELARVQDRIAAEVAQAHVQTRSAADRLVDAELGLKEARDSVEKNFAGLGETRRVGEVNILVIRPQEVIAAVQALAQAYSDYYAAVADLDRGQFRLYRALGAPAEAIMGDCIPAAPPCLGEGVRARLGLPVASPD